MKATSTAATVTYDIETGYRITLIKVLYVPMGSKAMTSVIEADQHKRASIQNSVQPFVHLGKVLPCKNAKCDATNICSLLRLLDFVASRGGANPQEVCNA